MIIPAALGFVQGEYETARIFLYQGLLVVIFAGFLSIATFRTTQNVSIRRDILEISSIFLLLPVILAFPFYTVIDEFSFIDAYFEALSCLTTTGLSLIPEGLVVPWSVDLWRGFIAWMGGLTIWIVASALIKHFGLGLLGQLSQANREGGTAFNFGFKLEEETPLLQRVLPIIRVYFSVSILTWGVLYFFEGNLLQSAMLAMATISTSGVILSHSMAPISVWSEIILAIFLLFALSRMFMMLTEVRINLKGILHDAEMRLAGLILFIFLVLSLIHDWSGLITTYNNEGVIEVILIAWGKFFTFLSFLTTSGLESYYWIGPSNEELSSFTLMTLCILVFIGGGIGTNAGGIKLWRLRMFLKQIGDDVHRMLFPSVVTALATQNLSRSKSGWEDTWVIFFFLNMILVLLVLILSLDGYNLQQGMTLALAAVSTTGPLIHSVLDSFNQSLNQLSDFSKIALLIAMVLGRLEVVLIFFLLSPSFFSRFEN
ncbi:MAG: hypothetical protein OXC02_03690 [Rhodobacteraceae bacterium]|nr:hypothetical protein [Paracoccaceae bacterium]